MPARPQLGRGASARLLDRERLHLQQGPINLIVGADGADAQVRLAFADARAAFAGLLEGLVAELETLRRPLGAPPPALRSATGRRMLAACTPHRGRWLTPMAAVAGAVADTVAEAAGRRARPARLYVNNGGDIALRLARGESFDVGVVASLRVAQPAASLRIVAGRSGVSNADADADAGIFTRGVATSGWDGHSFSFGVADAVTVFADSAAAADVAATLIANEVDVDHAAIQRLPAAELDPDSDLGDRLVTVAVPPLPSAAVAAALRRGAALAAAMVAARQIRAALLGSQRQWLGVGDLPAARRIDGTVWRLQ